MSGHYKTYKYTVDHPPDFLTYLTSRPANEYYVITGNYVLPLDASVW